MISVTANHDIDQLLQTAMSQKSYVEMFRQLLPIAEQIPDDRLESIIIEFIENHLTGYGYPKPITRLFIVLAYSEYRQFAQERQRLYSIFRDRIEQPADLDRWEIYS